MLQATPIDKPDTINNSLKWPRKVDLFGVNVTPTNYTEATNVIMDAACRGASGLVSCYSTHSLIEASRGDDFRRAANVFDMITPDGQPVRWALNILHQAGLDDRVYGPELTLRICKSAAEHGVSIYLYGSSAEVIAALRENLSRMFPDLKIVGAESPPYRQLTEAEDADTVHRINESGAGILFIGLGCPKQDFFAFEHRNRLKLVQVCVGAAFDFHSGNKKMAPGWMQRHALEWLYRLIHEPRRLCGRYLLTNSIFLLMLFLHFCGFGETTQKRSLETV